MRLRPRVRGWSPARRLACALGCSVATLVFGAVAFVGGQIAYGVYSYVRPFPACAFNATRWHWSPRKLLIFERYPTRLRMADDLVANHLKHGMTKDEVRALIGPPDEHPYYEPAEWVYLLGPWRNQGIDNEWLALDFDEQGRLTRFEIVHD